VFDRLFYRQGTPYSYEFDLLWLDGRDLRGMALVKRKERLKAVIPVGPAGQILYLEHLEERGGALFDPVVNTTWKESSGSGSTVAVTS